MIGKIKWMCHLTYILALASFMMGIISFLLPEQWEFQWFEKSIYASLFACFAIVFYLFYKTKELNQGQNKTWSLAIGICFVLFIFLLFAFRARLSKGQNWMMNPSTQTATIYKIDPEGFGKKRTAHYIFHYNGNAFDGHFKDESKIFHIGDTIEVFYSKKNPEQNLLKWK